MFARVFKMSLWIIVAVVLIWAVVIVYWQMSNRLVTPQDVGLYMVLLPLTVIGVYFIVRAVAGRRSAAPEATPSTTATTDTTHREDAHERAFQLAMPGVFVNSPAGAAATDLATTLVEGQSAVKPDTVLKGSDGFGILAGRVSELDMQNTLTALAALSARPEFAEARPSEAFQRALALLESPLNEAVMLLEELHMAWLPPPPGPDTPGHATARLRVLLFTPPEWPLLWRQLGVAWVREHLADSGWPAETWSIYNDTEVTRLGMLDQLNRDLNRESLDDLVLVLACDSYLTEAQIEHWDTHGMLYSQKHKQGMMPGEAAAALVFTRTATMTRLAPERSAPALSRLSLGRRAKSADERGEINAEVITELARHSLDNAKVSAEHVAALVCDDHRTSRTLETAGLVQAMLPTLNAVEDCARVDSACGFTGTAASIVALAVAHARASELKKPVLVTWVQDAIERGAAVISPPPVPATENTAHA